VIKLCGIAGIFYRNQAELKPFTLVEMTRTMIHRGPDEEGYFVNSNGIGVGAAGGLKNAESDGSVTGQAGGLNAPIRTLENHSDDRIRAPGYVGLGHRRLSIIDLSAGRQPLCNEDGSIWVTFNGEIYNFQSLKSELLAKGHQFRTNSDTETIVHAYEEWGERSVERLRGMFAYAIWDERRKSLFMARDRVGKKPLYFLASEKMVLFASEIKAILTVPGVSRKVDQTALSDYFSLLYIPSPKTIFADIQKLPAGHFATATEDSFKVQPYWDLQFETDYDASESQTIDGLLEILTEATRLRMISDVPLGAFLSGGVDSSAVVALMSQVSPEPVLTNSISFSVSNYDESDYARQVADKFSTRHNEFRVTPKAIPVIEKLAWHYDEPFADSSAVPTFYVSETARKNVTVSLSGDGGDENFAGYRRYFFDVRENYVRNLFPRFMQKSVFSLIGNLYPKADFLPQIFRGKAFISNVARDPVDAYFFSMSAFHGEDKKRVLNDDVLKSIDGYRTVDLFHRLYKEAPANDHLSRIQYLDIKTYLCEDILTKVDRASMAVSLEVRCPILDHIFMEYVAKIPSSLKLNGRNGKYIFKKALNQYLPDRILYRNKMGFGMPILEWLRADIRDYAESIVLNGAATQAFLRPKYVKTIWNQHQSGMRNRATELWAVMMLNLWHEKFA
jgi:asparagine synthase (glutamine-hydrolysing)